MPPSPRPRPRSANGSSAARPAVNLQHYLDVSRRPLQILVFLLPLVLFYEVALVFLLQSTQQVRTVLAHRYLLGFFDAFHIAPEGGLHLGGVAVIVVLLVWHTLNRDPWRIDWHALGIMAIEALLLALPLIAVGQIVPRLIAAQTVDVAVLWSAPTTLMEMDLASRIAISIGAGLYEELLFRMLLIAVIHTLLVDVGKASHKLGAAVAVVISAAAFSAYHFAGNSADISFQKLVFFFAAGLYFGGVYALRGFGIVVAVHAIYDILTVSLLSDA